MKPDQQDRESEYKRLFYAMRTTYPKLKPSSWRRKTLKLLKGKK